MSTLYDDDEDESPNNASADPVPKPLSASQLVDIPPDLLTANTNNSRMAIVEQTKLLSHKLKQCETIVLNAYRVSDFVPNCETQEQTEMWKETIIPILLKTINEDVVARWVMTDSFSAVRVLAITIQSAYEMIRATKGNPEAIEIAKKRIPEALDKIDKCIERAVNLTNLGMKQFNENTEIILKIAGPEVAKRVNNLAEFEGKINEALERQNNYLVNLYRAEGEAIRYNNLMNAVNERRVAVKNEIEQIERQKEELSDMIKQTERRVDGIPDEITQTRTVYETSSALWGLVSNTTSREVSEQVNNPNKEGDKNYLNSIIKAREDRIARTDRTGDAKKAVLMDLNVQYSEYEKGHKEALALFKALDANKEKTEREVNDTIEFNRMKIEETRKEAASMKKTFGHHGQSLVDCLTTVKVFGQSLKDSTSAYTPIYTIMNDIKAMVTLQVDMLKSSSPQMVFVAGKMLMNEVQFLSHYNLVALDAVKQSQGYTEVSLAVKPNITLMAIE